MIQGTYYKEWSSVLNREMEFKVYGSAGVPVLALPARSHYESSNRYIR